MSKGPLVAASSDKGGATQLESAFARRFPLFDFDAKIPAAESRHSPEMFVFDHDEAVRDSLLMLLWSFNIRGRAFSSSAALLAVLPAERPDCLIFDLSAPQTSGEVALEKLAALCSGMPIIGMTGEQSRQPTDRSVVPAMLEILDKPFCDSALRASIERVLTWAV